MDTATVRAQLLIGLASMTLVALAGPSAILAAGVVGTGSAASCTDAALNTALSGGGLVTFNCGGGLVTIDISPGAGGTGTKTIALDTTIDGASLITISGGHSVGLFWVNTGVNFTVQNLTIANGNRNSVFGGITSDAGTLTISNTTFTGNTAGLSHENAGPVTVTNSTFTGNSSVAIFTAGGTFTVTNSTFTDNGVSGGGGAIANLMGTVSVTDSTFTGNSANSGGAISNGGGTFTVTNSTFTDNTAPARGAAGGAIYNNQGFRSAGTLTVTNCTFTGNSADNGGAISNGGFVSGIARNIPGGTVSITNCTFTGNSADNGGAISNGGCIGDCGGDGQVTVDELLTLANMALGNAGSCPNGIPAGVTVDVSLILQAVNSALSGCGLGTVTVTNTIVANNPGGNCASSIIDSGHNLSSDGTCFTSGGTDLLNTDPMLAPLANYGGPTDTLALCTAPGVPVPHCMRASPAIDSGDDAVLGPPDNLTTDQRGLPRKVGAHVDIGAYEAP